MDYFYGVISIVNSLGSFLKVVQNGYISFCILEGGGGVTDEIYYLRTFLAFEYHFRYYNVFIIFGKLKCQVFCGDMQINICFHSHLQISSESSLHAALSFELDEGSDEKLDPKIHLILRVPFLQKDTLNFEI